MNTHTVRPGGDKLKAETGPTPAQPVYGGTLFFMLTIIIRLAFNKKNKKPNQSLQDAPEQTGACVRRTCQKAKIIVG